MSTAILVQVYDEMRRVAIAGSAVAGGDFRLKKLVSPLQQAGQKAPVFTKVAQAVQAVIDSNEKTASTALLDLTTLVNAILYTQGETGIAGNFEPLETTNLGGEATQASARVLKPLLEALSSTGSGRIEIIRDALERGIFSDLRLVKPALNAIDDPYPEISDLIVEKVLPLYGRAILPELQAKLKIKERSGGHLNRLRLLHRLDPVGSRDVIQLALSEGSKEMKVVAVECLGTSESDLVYLLEQVKAKARDVRAAALRALAAAGISRTDVVTALKNAIDSDDLGSIITRVRQCSLPAIQNYVLEQADKQLTLTLKCKDAKLQGPVVARLQQLVLCLEGRIDVGSEAFLLKCFENARAFAAIKSEPSGADLNELVAQVLARGTPKMKRRLVAAQATLQGNMLSSAFLAAQATMSVSDFFMEFSPLLKPLADKRARKGSTDHDRATALIDFLIYGGEYDRHLPGMGVLIRGTLDVAAPKQELDPRWLDAAIAAQSDDLVCKLARSGHSGFQQYLSARLADCRKVNESQGLLQTMVRIGHPAAADGIIDALRKLAKGTTYYYASYWYGSMITDLPRSTLPKFEALLPTLPEKMIDQLMDSVLALKNKPE